MKIDEVNNIISICQKSEDKIEVRVFKIGKYADGSWKYDVEIGD